MSQLTKQDVDVLIEALEAWERKGMEGRMMGSLLGAVFCRTDEEREKFEAQQKRSDEEAAAKQKVVKERSIMLRAKLIAIRDSMDADALLESSAAHR